MATTTKKDHSALYLDKNGELGGNVPEELHLLANGEAIKGYIKGLIIAALLLGGGAYLKHDAEAKVQQHLQTLSPEQRAEQQRLLDTYGGAGM